ncbi:MAG: lysine--tRNA ligase [Deltaproteobacteria bacterium]|nr:lysine--tRNA ligase [Deltaproteobacteria bacterium]
MESDSSDLVATRRRKLAELRARGIEPFPNDFRPQDTAASVQASCGALSREELELQAGHASLAGRIVALRDFGRASFLHLQDRSGRMQAYVKREVVGEQAFALFKSMDLGDFIGVTGRPFRTRTNELTIEAAGVRLLGKAVRPLPEKWHGLTDVEARYRQRYLDLVANPEVSAAFRLRSRLIDRIRSFLTARDFLEVETPMMQALAGGAAARPFVTHHNALDMDLYLRIAPELYLKRLLVGGFERVFELNRVFRNEGISVRHNPEFTMLEFYWAYATYDDLMQLTEELVVSLADELLGRRVLSYGDWSVDLTPPWRRIAIPEYVAERAGVALEAVLALDLATVKLAADKLGVAAANHDYVAHYGPAAAGYLLVDTFEAVAEPELIQPTFVHQYPAAVSPLARRNAVHAQFVDRFEAFVVGRELANAFSELNDPDDQRARFEEQARARAAGDQEAHVMDEDFLRALEHGMPPAAGEGIGIDRLVMLFTNAASIRDVILFPHLRPEQR